MCLIRVLLAVMLCSGATALAESADDPVLSTWLDAHANLKTWSADLVQTRHLAALSHPLISTGRVYYSQPGLFRWELGQPPETIALRSTNELLLVYPGLKRAEHYPLDRDSGGPLRDVITLMEAGFPRDEDSLRKQYTVSTDNAGNESCRITLKPRAATARKLVARVSLVFQTNVFTLAESEIEFADGSRLRNTFTDSISNEPFPSDLFSTNLPPDYKRVEPFKR